MTVTSDLARVVYTGNGTTKVFSTGFSFQSNLDVLVILTDVAGVETTQAEVTNYTLTGATHANDAPVAGTVTMVVAPAAGTHLTIVRNVQFFQDLDGTELSTMDAGDQEEMYDKIWHALSQLKDAYGRTLHQSGGAINPVPGTWVPLIAAVADGPTRTVLQVTGWTGGPAGSTPPTFGMYIGPTSFVSTAAAATNIKGADGAQGNQGATGPAGPQGPQGIQGPIGPGGSGSGDMVRANNLNDVISISTSRANLGLGNSATRNVGTTSADVAQGDTAALKADKTYVDTQDATLQTNINAKAATTYVDAQDNAIIASVALKAPLASPTFTGDPKAPTPAPGDNDTSVATTAFVTAAVAAAPPSTANPLYKQVDKFQNENVTGPRTMAGYGDSMLLIAKDGTVQTWGDAGSQSSANPNSARAAGGQNIYSAFEFRRAFLPAGLLGNPAQIVNNGMNSFLITDQGDVCVAGKNTSGDAGLNVTAGTAIDSYTLLPSTNIGPRSAGGTNRRVMEIETTGLNGDPTCTNSATYFRCFDGTLWACGLNNNGGLAQGNTTQLIAVSQCLKNDGAGNVAIADCAKIAAWGTTNQGSVGYIDTSGKVRLAGALGTGAPGRNTGVGSQNVFRPIFTVADGFGALPAAYVAIDIIGHRNDTVMIRCADKCLYGWGYNGNGQLGIANATQQNNPVKVGSGTSVAAAFNGNVERFFDIGRGDVASYICQMTDGTIYGWGFSGVKTLPCTVADNSTVSTPLVALGPLAGAGVAVLTNVQSNCSNSSGNAQVTCALLANNTMVTWGQNAFDGAGGSFASNTPRVMTFPARAGSTPTPVKFQMYGVSGAISGTNGSLPSMMIFCSDNYLVGLGYNIPQPPMTYNDGTTVSISGLATALTMQDVWFLPT